MLSERINIAAPRERVWAFFEDVRAVAGCFPGCEEVEQLDAKTYRASVKVQIGPFSGSFSGTGMITEKLFPNRIAWVNKAEDRLTSGVFEANSSMELSSVNGAECFIEIQTEVRLFGSLVMWGHRLLENKGRKMLKEFLAEVKQRVESSGWSG